MMVTSLSKQNLVLESLDSDEEEEKELLKEIVSDVWLQLLLFLNLCFFLPWLSATLMTISVKYVYLHYLYKFILITVILAITIVEVLRLYLGYLGNLTEKVPELAGFWLLTLLLQLPMQLFLLLNEQLLLLPMERACNAVMVTLIVAELIVGFVALARMSRHQARKFAALRKRMMQELHKQS